MTETLRALLAAVLIVTLAATLPVVELVIRSGLLTKLGDSGRAEQMNRLATLASAAGFGELATRYRGLAARYVREVPRA